MTSTLTRPASTTENAAQPETPGGRSGFRSSLSFLARHWGPTLSVVILVLVLGWALLPGVFASQDPLTGVPADKLQSPSGAHLFGTDHLGRDVFARTVHGTARTLITAGLAVGLGVVVGTLLGLAAGTCGRIVDAIAMRLADVLLAIPAVLIVLVIVSAYEPGPISLGIGVGLASIATFARLTRAEVARVRSTEYVEAARLSGANGISVVFSHILPHVLGPVLALLVVELGAAILAISGLGFLGFGTPPPTPEWGLLVSEGRQYLGPAWWMSTLPGLVIVATVLSLASAGRALQKKVRI
ncbi:MAG: ABC transporter permease [Galactobacter sp.]